MTRYSDLSKILVYSDIKNVLNSIVSLHSNMTYLQSIFYVLAHPQIIEG